MTESEAIKKVKEFGLYHAIGDLPNSMLTVKAFEMAIKALEEIQQYRAIGTVEEVKRMQRYSALAKKHSTIGQVIDSCAEYEAIGTVEECREARERQIPKKPNKRQVGTNILMSKIYYCPICDKKLYDCAIKKGKLDYVSPGSKKSKFCEDCGQSIDWSETI